MPTFTEIIIDPGHGFCGGEFDAGHQFQNLHEVSLVDEIVSDLKEVFIAENIPFQLLPTRIRPGMTAEERISTVQARQLMISLHFGHARQMHKNGGAIYTRNAKEHPLCQILADCLDAWGMRTCGSFCGTKILTAAFPHLPIFDPENSTLGVQIEPFCLNAIDAIVFAARLRTLGASLAHVLVAYMRGQNPALGVKRTQIWGNGPMGRDVFGG